MAKNEIHCAEDACRIRDRMGRIRSQMDREVKGIKKGANNLMNLKYQMRSHPWVGVGVATVLGFLVVPKKKRQPELQLDDQEIQKLVERGGIKVQAHQKHEKSMVCSATTLVANAALRAALAYAGQKFGKVSGKTAASNVSVN